MKKATHSPFLIRKLSLSPPTNSLRKVRGNKEHNKKAPTTVQSSDKEFDRQSTAFLLSSGRGRPFLSHSLQLQSRDCIPFLSLHLPTRLHLLSLSSCTRPHPASPPHLSGPEKAEAKKEEENENLRCAGRGRLNFPASSICPLLPSMERRRRKYPLQAMVKTRTAKTTKNHQKGGRE